MLKAKLSDNSEFELSADSITMIKTESKKRDNIDSSYEESSFDLRHKKETISQLMEQ